MTGAALALTVAIAIAGCSPQRSEGFERDAAVDFIAEHWNDPAHIRVSVLNYQFWSADDCAFFASSALWAAGLPKTAEWTDESYDVGALATRLDYPGPTRSVMLADELEQYLIDEGLGTRHPLSFDDPGKADAAPGDLVTYDWNANGIIDHVAVVRSVDRGQLRIAQHNPNRQDQLWSWSGEERRPLAEVHPAAKAYLIHITGHRQADGLSRPGNG
ncbi:hypothetical protein BH09ACT3_BH09ACT3_03630 [soil metagenome]